MQKQLVKNVVIQNLSEQNRKWIGTNTDRYLLTDEQLRQINNVYSSNNAIIEGLDMKSFKKCVLGQLTELELRITSLSFDLQSLPDQLDLELTIYKDALLNHLVQIGTLRANLK